MKSFNQYINEGIRDKMTAKEGALDKLNLLVEELIPMLLEDGYFDTYEEAKTFLTDEDIIDNLARMKGFELDTDEIYVEISQFYVDEYLFNHNLPLKFAFDKNHKDDLTIVGSDAYNKINKMFYYEDDETREKRSKRRGIITNESIRDKMTPKSEDDIKIALDKLSVGEKLVQAKKNNALHLLSEVEIRYGIQNLLIYRPGFIFYEFKYEELSKYVTDDSIKNTLNDFIPSRYIKGYKEEKSSIYKDIYLYLYKHGYLYDNKDNLNNLWFKHHTRGAYSGGHFSVNGYSSLSDAVDYVERMEKLNEGIRDKMTPKSEDDILKNTTPDNLLYGGINHKSLKLMKVAIDKGADINNVNHEEYGPPLNEAVNKNFLEGVKLLLESGADIEVKDDDGTPFFIAVYYGKLRIIKELLKYKPNPFATNRWGDILLDSINVPGNQYSKKHEEIVDLITNYVDNYKVNEGIRDKMTPKSEEDIEKAIKDYSPNQILELGYKNKAWYLVKKAVDKGVDVHFKDDMTIRVACLNGELELVKYLVDNGAYIDTFDYDCLVKACYSGNLELVKYLVDNGADVNADQSGKVLRSACSSGHPEIVKYLLEKGADERQITSSQVTFGENRRIILDLLDNVKKVNEGVRDLMTPKSEDDILTSLKGLSTHQKLILGCKNDSVLAVKKAMEEDDQKRDEEDESIIHIDDEWPLRLAVRSKSLGVVKFLLDNGADVHAGDDNAFSEASGNRPMIKLLRQYESKKYISEKLTDYPYRFKRTLESFLLERDNSMGTAREVYIVVYTRSEMNELKKVSYELGYTDWPVSLEENIDFTNYGPYYIFFRLDTKNIGWTYHLQMNTINVSNTSNFDGVYDRKFTMKDINMFKMILRNGEIVDRPRYEPRKRVLEKYNSREQANIIRIKIEDKDELKLLEDAILPLRYSLGIAFKWALERRSPITVLLELGQHHIAKYGYVNSEMNQRFSEVPILDNVWERELTIRDLPYIVQMLKAGKIVDETPNYVPRKRVLEGIENYPYRFKTLQEMIRDFGKDWYSDGFGEVGWVDDMDYLLGKDYPYKVEEIGEVDLHSDDYLPLEVDYWSVCGRMLTKNAPTYKPKKFNREI